MLTKPTPRFVAIQSSYWACYCCIISFSSVYLLDQGFSNAQVGLVISVGGVCGLRILWVFLVVPHWPTLLGISICYPLSWVLTALLLILRYRRAKWHEKAKGTVLPKEA